MHSSRMRTACSSSRQRGGGLHNPPEQAPLQSRPPGAAPQEQAPPEADPPGADSPRAGTPRSRHPPEQAPPKSRHPWSTPPRAGTPQSRHPLARSPLTSSWGVGLDQIPLNFPLGCGPGPDLLKLPPWVWAWTRSPQLPAWLWAWIRSPSTSPLGVGLEPSLARSSKLPLGCGPGNLQSMLGYHPLETCCKACWDTTCNACWDTTPPSEDKQIPVKT